MAGWLCVLPKVVLKFVSHGIIFDDDAFLRHGWNQLDFLVVVIGWLPFVITIEGNITGLRAIRAIRPLRTLTHLPGMKKQVDTLIHSMPKLANVGLLILFIVTLFGIMGVQVRTLCPPRQAARPLPHAKRKRPLKHAKAMRLAAYAHVRPLAGHGGGGWPASGERGGMRRQRQRGTQRQPKADRHAPCHVPCYDMCCPMLCAVQYACVSMRYRPRAETLNPASAETPGPT